jgi:citrate synthase
VRAVNDFRPGLEGVIAFETEIAEPDKEGSALRYRGVDIEELVGHYPFEQVWGLLVDGSFEPGMPKAERIELQDPSGSVMADLQAALATLGSKWGLKQLVDIEPEQARDDLARLSAATLSIVAQSARGDRVPVPESEVEQGENVAAQFLIRWRGEADPRHVKAVDTYWVSAAEHGLNSSTFTARIVASTGADCAAAMSSAVGALSGPLHGGAPTRVLTMLDEVEASGDADAYVHDLLDRGERIMGFGHRVYRAEDPRARVLRRTARNLGSRRVEVAEALEEAARAALREKSPDRVLETNVEFWAAVVLDVAEIPPEMYPPMFGCARVAGWSAHIIEQRRTGRLIRPSARYVGPPAHAAAETR